MAFYKIHDKFCSMFHCHELVVQCSEGILWHHNFITYYSVVIRTLFLSFLF